MAEPSLLVLGLNYSPEPIGIGPYTTDLAEGFAQRGWNVRVVAGEPYYPAWSRFEGAPRGWSTRRENDVEVHRCPHYVPQRPTGPRRILHHASFALSALFPALMRSEKRTDVVIVVAPSLLSVPVGWLVAKRREALLWLHIQDFEVDAAQATGLIGSRAGRLAAAIERQLLKSADIISSIGPAMCRRLFAKGIASDRVFELRNWANHEGRGTDRDYRKEWNLGERRVLLYSGNIANKQGLDTVIETARRMSVREDAIFLICGEGPERERLEGLAAPLENVRFEDLQPAQDVPALLRLADIHLLPQRAEAADLVLPSKLTNMLASGRPVVATAAPDTGLAAEIAGCGIAVPPEDPESLAEALSALLDDPARRQSLGENAARRAADRWSREAILNGADREIRQRTGR